MKTMQEGGGSGGGHMRAGKSHKNAEKNITSEDKNGVSTDRPRSCNADSTDEEQENVEEEDERCGQTALVGLEGKRETLAERKQQVHVRQPQQQ